ncbi:cytochrome b561 [Blastomyces gilchristii SLH14081]|uniref:Cytochrome b561 n=1 Tax=Blastomyces gilchristii (strain SLH14081) TaxID=559298 RepID=A0A179UFI5_BLAGS|nr:cytochrome b561 [Blastomyces gilchristii SLH14081]OAT06796.1 cytochrome b561 [Blastomyces gilchristii SLH14081]
MASATGIPEQSPVAIGGNDEQEPLLGRPGDVSQKEGQALVTNLVTGSATIAQAGIWILAALVWNGVFSHELIFFSPHPLLNSAAILLTTQAILILQPTHTPAQKRSGTLAHFGLLAVANLCFVSALIIIEINKSPAPRVPPPLRARHHGPHHLHLHLPAGACGRRTVFLPHVCLRECGQWQKDLQVSPGQWIRAACVGAGDGGGSDPDRL